MNVKIILPISFLALFAVSSFSFADCPVDTKKVEDKKPENLVAVPEYTEPPKPVVKPRPVAPKAKDLCHCSCRCAALPPPPEKKQYQPERVITTPVEERPSSEEHAQNVTYPSGTEVKLVVEPGYKVKEQKITEGCPNQAN